MTLSEPSPRVNFFTFRGLTSVYVWGGRRQGPDKETLVPVDDLDCLYEFSYPKGAWERLQLKGQHPPGIYLGGSARIGDSAYFYGGIDENGQSSGSLYQLNLTTLTWQECSPSETSGSPGRKHGFGMVEYKNSLVIHGGCTPDGNTNDLHMFDVTTGAWSSPKTTGIIPEPDAHFNFTKISPTEVVKCDQSFLVLYILDLFRMRWTQLCQNGDNFGTIVATTGVQCGRPQLLVIGTKGISLLDLKAHDLREIHEKNSDLPDFCTKRRDFSATVLLPTPTSVEIILFGGRLKDDVPQKLVSDTTMIVLKKYAAMNDWWILKTIISGERIKRRCTFFAEQFCLEPVEVAVENNKFDLMIGTRNPVRRPGSNTSQTVLDITFSLEALIIKDEFEDVNNIEKPEFSGEVAAAVAKKQSIRRKVANVLLHGLPGSGKTSLLGRLLNKSFELHISSTGMCEKPVVVDIGPYSTQTSVYSGGEKHEWKEIDFHASILSQLNIYRAFIPQDTKSEALLALQNGEPDSPVMGVSISDIENHVTEVFRNHNVKDMVDLRERNSLYIRDTGGQIEFQESLSLFIFGPSVYVYVLRTDIDILAKNVIQYRTSNGEIINKYESSISTLDALIQFMTSVSAADTTDKTIFQEGGTAMRHEPIVFIVGTHIDKLGPKARHVLDGINRMLHAVLSQRNFYRFIRYADGYRVMYEIDNPRNENGEVERLRSDLSRFVDDRNEYTVDYPVSYLLFCLELQNVNEAVMSMDDFKKLAAKFYIEEKEIKSLLQFLHFRLGVIQHYNIEGISDVVIKDPQVLFNKVTELIVETFVSSGSLPTSQQERFSQNGILESSVFVSLMSKKDKLTPEQFILFLLHLRIAVQFTDKAGVLKYFIPSVLNHVPKSPSDTVDSDITPLIITFDVGHTPIGLLGMLISYLINPEENQEESPEVSQEIVFDLLEDRIYQDQVSLLVNSSEEAHRISIRGHLTHLEINIVPENSPDSKPSSESLEQREAALNVLCNNIRLVLTDRVERSLRKLRYNMIKMGPTYCLACPVENCRKFHQVKKGRACYIMHCYANHHKLRLPRTGGFWFSEGSFEPPSPPQASADTTTVSGPPSTPAVDSTAAGPLPTATAGSTEGPTQPTQPAPSSLSTPPTPAELATSNETVRRVPDFCLRTLTLLKWNDEEGEPQTLRLRDAMSLRWREVGTVLGVDVAHMNEIELLRQNDVKQCCREVLQKWLENESPKYEASWKGLLDLLDTLEFDSLANSLKTALL